MRKCISTAFIAVLVLIVLLCSGCSWISKQFSKAGMTITLTAAFKEHNLEETTAYYSSSDVYVGVLKEEKTLLAEKNINADMNLTEYAALCKKNNNASYAQTVQSEGLTYFAFTNTDSINYYAIFVSVYKTDDAFWVFSFACELDNYDKYMPNFITWSKSVKFDS